MPYRKRIERHATTLSKNITIAIIAWAAVGVAAAAAILAMTACEAYTRTTGGTAEATSRTATTKVQLIAPKPSPATTTRRIILRPPPQEPPCPAHAPSPSPSSPSSPASP